MFTRTVLITLTAIVSLTACHKDSPKPPVAPPVDSSKTPTLGTLNINLTNPPGNGSYELIISEPGGKVLLDTIAPYGVAIKTGLRTNASLVDITTIDTVFSYDRVNVYKAVNPSNWINPFPLSYQNPSKYSSSGSIASSVHFTNFPYLSTTGTDIYSKFFFSNSPYMTSGGYSYNAFYGTLDVNYPRIPGAYNYLAILPLGLYKLYMPASDKDTVDLTRMDTALTLNYSSVSDFALSYLGSSFIGVTDSLNRQKDINFISNNLYPSPTGPLQYAKTPMQAYLLNIIGVNSLNDQVGFYSYGPDIPATGAFLSSSELSVQSSTVDNLSVKFNSPGKTTYYKSYWSTSDYGIELYFYASPDSSTIHVSSLLNNLKAKFLSTSVINGLSCKSITFEDIPGFSYSNYLSYTGDPSKVFANKNILVPWYIKYIH